MSIAVPRLPNKHPKKLTECQLAIEDKVIDLLAEAVNSGWNEEEVLVALTSIVDTTMLAIHQDMLAVEK